MRPNIEYKNLGEMESSVEELFNTQDKTITESLSLIFNNFRTYLFGRLNVLEITNMTKNQLNIVINDWFSNALANGSLFRILFKDDKYLISVYNREIFFKIKLDNGIKSMLFDNYLGSLMSQVGMPNNAEQTL